MRLEEEERMKTRLRTAALIGLPMFIFIVAVSLPRMQADTEATITTDQNKYSVGQGMKISGSGFTANALITVSVLRPDHATDMISPPVVTDGNGAFQATYTPPLITGRYKITATDGANTATTASTEADAIGYNKQVYNKGAIAPNDNTGVWTSGNAGSNYLENQWAYYQYQVTGVTSGGVPDFDVSFNHFQTNTSAIFVDGFANFRVCLDCTDSSNTSGPQKGMLSDGVPFPPTSTTNWKDASGAISLINHPFINGACQAAEDPVNTPSQDHCFHVG